MTLVRLAGGRAFVIGAGVNDPGRMSYRRTRIPSLRWRRGRRRRRRPSGAGRSGLGRGRDAERRQDDEEGGSEPGDPRQTALHGPRRVMPGHSWVTLWLVPSTFVQDGAESDPSCPKVGRGGLRVGQWPWRWRMRAKSLPTFVGPADGQADGRFRHVRGPLPGLPHRDLRWHRRAPSLGGHWGREGGPRDPRRHPDGTVRLTWVQP